MENLDPTQLGSSAAAVFVVWMFIKDRAEQRKFDQERDNKFVNAIEKNTEASNKVIKNSEAQMKFSEEQHKFMKSLNGKLTEAALNAMKEKLKK